MLERETLSPRTVVTCRASHPPLCTSVRGVAPAGLASTILLNVPVLAIHEARSCYCPRIARPLSTIELENTTVSVPRGATCRPTRRSVLDLERCALLPLLSNAWLFLVVAHCDLFLLRCWGRLCGFWAIALLAAVPRCCGTHVHCTA